MTTDETFYTIALTRLTGFNHMTALQLYRELGGGRAVYDHRHDLRQAVPYCTPRLAAALHDWDLALSRAESEMAFMARHHIAAIGLNDDAYPRRLATTADAPVVMYYLGSAPLNRQRVVSIVGTRHATSYGQDLTTRFVRELKELCPDVLIVSGLAYGIDIVAHRAALEQGYDTVGVLAHGLDDLYPPRHRDTARLMTTQGGLLTEYMSETLADKRNFVKRNRIVAGMADATVIVESASHGGGLITCRIAQDEGRSVFAFPGAVGAPWSEGCNNLIRDSGAQLVTSACDFVCAMGWQHDAARQQAARKGIERTLFPELSEAERRVVQTLADSGDLQLGTLAVKTNIAVGQLTAMLFEMEMKGVVRPLAGGSYHLIR